MSEKLTPNDVLRLVLSGISLFPVNLAGGRAGFKGWWCEELPVSWFFALIANFPVISIVPIDTDVF
jgi:hypothetical protein